MRLIKTDANNLNEPIGDCQREHGLCHSARTYKGLRHAGSKMNGALQLDATPNASIDRLARLDAIRWATMATGHFDVAPINSSRATAHTAHCPVRPLISALCHFGATIFTTLNSEPSEQMCTKRIVCLENTLAPGGTSFIRSNITHKSKYWPN